MLLGHTIAYFFPHALYPDLTWFRLIDRALLPVFLVSVGFNSGRRIGIVLLSGAVVTSLAGFLVYGVVRIYVLGTIIIVKCLLEPLMRILLQSREIFWFANLFFAVISYHSQILCEFGTAALILGIAGWLNVNRSVIPRYVVTPELYFVFSGVVYFHFAQTDPDLPFTLLQSLVFAVLLSLVMWLLLGFRLLLMNSIQRKRKSLVQKASHFVGHKSFEIYVIQHVFFFLSYNLLA